MNTDFAIYLMLLIGLFFGWLFAFITYRRKIVRERKTHKLELRVAENEAWGAGFNEGWKALADWPMVVKELCNQYYHTHRP